MQNTSESERRFDEWWKTTCHPWRKESSRDTANSAWRANGMCWQKRYADLEERLKAAEQVIEASRAYCDWADLDDLLKLEGLIFKYDQLKSKSV